MKLSILIPAYNESATIVELINQVKSVPLEKEGVEKEIIVIDDGSKDSTKELVRNIENVILLEHIVNKGKGGAIKTGLKNATGDIIIVQDADLECNPNEYYSLISPIIEGQAEVVYGSRFLSRAQKKYNKLFFKKHNESYLLAYIGGRIITITANILFNIRITDEPMCYKVFKSEIIRQIKINGNKFDWEPEVTAKLAKKGIRIHEVPVSYHPRTKKEGKHINWKDGLHAIWSLIKYRLID